MPEGGRKVRRKPARSISARCARTRASSSLVAGIGGLQRDAQFLEQYLIRVRFGIRRGEQLLAEEYGVCSGQEAQSLRFVGER